MENTDSDFDREKLQERLAKLSGGVAVVKVGAMADRGGGVYVSRADSDAFEAAEEISLFTYALVDDDVASVGVLRGDLGLLVVGRSG